MGREREEARRERKDEKEENVRTASRRFAGEPHERRWKSKRKKKRKRNKRARRQRLHSGAGAAEPALTFVSSLVS